MRFGLPSLVPASKNLSVLYYKSFEKAYLFRANRFEVFFVQHWDTVIGPDSHGMLSGSSLDVAFTSR